MSGGVRRAGPAAVAAILVACTTTSNGDESEALVRVPNRVLGEVVERTACAGGVEIELADSTVGSTAESVAEPVVELVLGGVESPDSSAGPIVVSVVESVSTIPGFDGDDPWVWLDPQRLVDLSQTIGGALVAADAADPTVVDRCLARLQVEMDRLVDEIEAVIAAVPTELRVVDGSVPGMVYVVDRFRFELGESPAAAGAAGVLSFDDPGGPTSYDDAMRDHFADAVDLLLGGN